MDKQYTLLKKTDYWLGTFNAMACPCDIIIYTDDKKIANEVTQLAFDEAKRIEYKFSRYRQDNIIYKINHAEGKAVKVDDEVAALLDFAHQCYELSNGKFDITSGVLREIWNFNGGDKIPSKTEIYKIKPRIGWHKVTWGKHSITLPANMEIDFGGLAKEYAVDQAAKLIQPIINKGVLINFGGDIFCFEHLDDSQKWNIGIDDANNTGQQSRGEIKLVSGGLATSGDVRRFLLKEGVRYGHILNPKTARPVMNAPSSVTVIANTCIEAGVLSTFAMLEGKLAETFLAEQQVQFYCQW